MDGYDVEFWTLPNIVGHPVDIIDTFRCADGRYVLRCVDGSIE